MLPFKVNKAPPPYTSASIWNVYSGGVLPINLAISVAKVTVLHYVLKSGVVHPDWESPLYGSGVVSVILTVG